jgi:hypothetical protein
MDAYALTLDQANWVSERARQQAGKGQDQREDLFRPIEPKLILVRNDSGETIPAFGVVALSGAVVDTGVVFTTAIKPASTVYPVAVNGPSPIAAGLTGYVFVGPVVEVLYDGTTAITAGQGWGVNGFEIASFPTGKPIAWFSMLAVARSSLNTAYAIIEPMRQLIIKAPSGGIAGRRGSLLGSASCTVQVLSTTTAMMSQSTVSITVYNWSSSAVCTKGDRHGVAANIHGRWVIVAEDCTDKGSVLPPKGGGSVLRPAGDPIGYGIQSITSFGTFHEVRYSGAGVGGGFS